MKYKNFEEWINAQNFDFSPGVENVMRDVWNAAVENYPEDRTKNEINELQGIITGALEIQCTCDQAQIKKGYRCSCGKQVAVQKSVADLTLYLKELKKCVK